MSKMSDFHIEISQLVAEGYSDQEISEKLRIPTGWVESVREDMNPHERRTFNEIWERFRYLMDALEEIQIQYDEINEQ